MPKVLQGKSWSFFITIYLLAKTLISVSEPKLQMLDCLLQGEKTYGLIIHTSQNKMWHVKQHSEEKVNIKVSVGRPNLELLW